ncbi:MAG: hypothetical protein LUI05_08325 [Oscillospiraceae bacterium]|nr:hypothetical protein [Oscillospiraceae bacterium]
MASNQNKTHSRSTVNASFIGSIFLGICILIAGISIGGGVRKLNKTVSEKEFSDTNTYNSPEHVQMSEKKYLTEGEAAEYLNLTETEILSLITSGEITEYVKTATGYSISVTVLDSWFDNEAYQNKLNATEPAAADDEEQ